MATQPSKQIDQFQGFATLIQWPNLAGNVTPASSDVGEAVYVGHLLFLSVGYINTAGTATAMDFQGSWDGINFSTLGASAFTVTGAGVTRGITDPPLFIRPANVAGAGSTATAFVLGKRTA